MKIFKNKKPITKIKGFIIPLTLLVSFIILTISTGITVILSKELYFSRLSRQSQIAYYAADDALSCTIDVDDKYIDPSTGLGLFPYKDSSGKTISPGDVLDKLTQAGDTVPALNAIKCATSDIFPNISYKDFIINGQNGVSSSFSMKMDLGDGTFRCADVVVNKTESYRQIIARGYTSCDKNSPSRMERAIIDTTLIK